MSVPLAGRLRLAMSTDPLITGLAGAHYGAVR